MKKYLMTVPILLLIEQSSSSAELQCFRGKIKYVEENKEKIIQEDYCYNDSLRKIYSTGRCTNPGKCLADFNSMISIKYSELEGQKGSPNFKLCKKVGGVPQIIHFWDTKKWIKSSRCIFKDASYIDIGSIAVKVKYVY